jgi:hypothetical protein
MDLNLFAFAEMMAGLIVYLGIGVICTKYWYSPAIDEVDEQIRKNGSLEEVGIFRTIGWCFLMIMFWPILGPYELHTDLRHFYPKYIST